MPGEFARARCERACIPLKAFSVQGGPLQVQARTEELRGDAFEEHRFLKTWVSGVHEKRRLSSYSCGAMGSLTDR